MESGGLRVESELEMSLDFCEQQEGHPPRSQRSSDRHPALDAGTKANFSVKLCVLCGDYSVNEESKFLSL